MAKETNTTKLAVMANDITYIKERIEHIDEQIGDNYVTKAEFTPIQKIVYGLVGVILLAVAGGLLTTVIK